MAKRKTSGAAGDQHAEVEEPKKTKKLKRLAQERPGNLCPCHVVYDGKVRYCTKERGHKADGTDVFAWHKATLQHSDPEKPYSWVWKDGDPTVIETPECAEMISLKNCDRIRARNFLRAG